MNNNADFNDHSHWLLGEWTSEERKRHIEDSWGDTLVAQAWINW